MSDKIYLHDCDYKIKIEDGLYSQLSYKPMTYDINSLREFIEKMDIDPHLLGLNEKAPKQEEFKQEESSALDLLK